MTQVHTTGIDEDIMAHSDVEGRTVQRALYRRLSSSGYKKRLSELLRDQYNPLRLEEPTSFAGLKTEQQESLA